MRHEAAWARGPVARTVREVLLLYVLGPLIDGYARCRVSGHEHLQGLRGPVVLVANHASHMDTPTILRALPPRLRRRTAVAAAADYFYKSRGQAALVALAFNTVPVQRYGAGPPLRAASDLGRTLDEGWSLLVYAEGTRSRDGAVGRLRSGAAVVAARHGCPIVPVLVTGTHAIMPPGSRWMRRTSATRRSPVEIRFGAPIWPRAHEERMLLMERVRRFFEAAGAVTTPHQRVLVRRAPAPGEPSAR